MKETDLVRIRELEPVFATHVRSILELISEIAPLDPEVLANTPLRVAHAYLRELLSGYFEDPKEILTPEFPAKYDELVIVRDIEFWSLCQHHILPFWGRVHVCYIPTGRVVGLSKLARLVYAFSRRLQLQETLTQEIVDAIQDTLQPLGAGVIIEATHTCMCARGARVTGAVTITSALTGVLRDNSNQARQEFLSLVRR